MNLLGKLRNTTFNLIGLIDYKKVSIIFTLALLLLILSYLVRTKITTLQKEKFTSILQKPIIWMYWENTDNRRKPIYLDLCFETVKKHCSKDFEIILLDNNSYHRYLPNIRNDIDKLPVALKADYIRLQLLYNYGGVWLDHDTIVLKSLKSFYDKLRYYDFVGSGCTGYKCSNGYPRPSNALMAAKKNSIVMKNSIKSSDKILNKASSNKDYEFGYFDLGKYVIWKELDKLIKKNYKYYHYDSSYTGNRDREMKWINLPKLLKSKVDFLDEGKLHCIFLYNSDFRHANEKWFTKLSRNEILSSDTVIGKMLKKSLSC